MSDNHPLELNGILHKPDCAVWFTPAFRVVRNECNCQIEIKIHVVKSIEPMLLEDRKKEK